MTEFEQRLAEGRVAEGLIAAWLRAHGSSVLPVYEIEKSTGKGPQLFTPKRGLIAPDMLEFSAHGIRWIEAKHKSRFTWHYSSKQWQTGIDRRHFEDYKRVAEQTRLPVFLLFFHRESRPSASDLSNRCPSECPTGLFFGDLQKLANCKHHDAPPLDPIRPGMRGHGRSGMIYWARKDLRLLASKEEVIAARARLEMADA